MATDLQQIVKNLTGFYDFAGKTIVAVGAGGGQLFEYARAAARVTAVDPDREALERLSDRARQLGLAGKLSLLPADLLAVAPRGDVLLFEFCLHLLPDAERALAHAHPLAPDLVVLGHAPDSRWSWCAAEEQGVAAAWQAVARRQVRRQVDVEGVQVFPGYAALAARLAGQGPESLARIGAYRGQTDLTIPMPYRLALL